MDLKKLLQIQEVRSFEYPNCEGLKFDMYLIIMVFQQLVVPVSIGAVSGAAGQLHNRKKELITSP